jgi:hypothetical protein
MQAAKGARQSRQNISALHGRFAQINRGEWMQRYKPPFQQLRHGTWIGGA